MKNSYTLFLFLTIVCWIISSCTSEAYTVYGELNLPELPVYYGLVGDSNDVRILYTQSEKADKSFNFIFKEKSGIMLRKGSEEYLANLIKRDERLRLYNTTSNTNFIFGDKITLTVDNHKGECVMPEKAIFNPEITSIEFDSFDYIFNIKLNIANIAAISKANYIGINHKMFYNGRSVRAVLRPFETYLRTGVDFTPFNSVIRLDSTDFYLTNDFKLYLRKDRGTYDDVPQTEFVSFPSNFDFRGTIKLELTLISLDGNINNYIKTEKENAQGIQDPLSTFSAPYRNITNAYGFIGCFNTSKRVINY